ncbi:MAG: hypothetical protein A2133_00590 [Actinobacteria bacterium RBG_16_64_13]|nr:MAG: hypothetical protein A2133_00590 [Actinobacteria bacterium RBG_16_64_13]
MLEIVELRVIEKNAWRVFGSDEGISLGSIRKVQIPGSDPRMATIAQLQRELVEGGEQPLFSGWNIHRHYSAKELAEAELLTMWISAVFEPAGEETKTVYDETDACPLCGVGRRQVGDLSLDTRRIPKRADLAQTIANEVVFSPRLVALLTKEATTGVEFRSVRHRGKEVSEDWLQPVITSPSLDVVEPTQYGTNLFDHDPEGRFRCPLGHTLGLNLISELFLDRSTWAGEDFCATRQLVGVKRGLLRPRASLLISQRLYQLLKREKARGFKVEVAHLS